MHEALAYIWARRAMLNFSSPEAPEPSFRGVDKQERLSAERLGSDSYSTYHGVHEPAKAPLRTCQNDQTSCRRASRATLLDPVPEPRGSPINWHQIRQTEVVGTEGYGCPAMAGTGRLGESGKQSWNWNYCTKPNQGSRLPSR
jgi:hypothetical protein